LNTLEIKIKQPLLEGQVHLLETHSQFI